MVMAGTIDHEREDHFMSLSVSEELNSDGEADDVIDI